MHYCVDAAYADSRAEDLRWSLTHPTVPSLAELDLTAHDRQIHLCVLGASHQVVVEHGDHRLVETVAYLPSVRDALPQPGTRAELTHAPVGATYDIRTRVDRLCPEMVHDRARWLRCHLAGEKRAVVAEFPGEPDAITALALETPRPGRIGWTTWHVYPQHGQAVRTRTSIALDGPEERA